uniref:Uncharacterized protein n=1 Tax=Oryza punctata TaxID=4537 RepID=A0A0E0L6C8_ORYPU
MSSKDVSLRLDSEQSSVEMQLVEYGTSSISAVSVLASECLDSCTSAPLCLEYGVISKPAAPTVGVEQPVQYVDWDSLELDETKRKPRKINQKNLPPEPSTPKRTTNEATIMQESPGMVTRRRLAMLLGGTSTSGVEGAREMASTSGGPSIPKKKKMTPKKMKTT